MKIDLPEDLERFIRDAVDSGSYVREEDVVRDALSRLKQTMPLAVNFNISTRTPVSPEELDRRLLAAGLMIQLPDPTQDIDDDDEPPIEIEGEPISETIIRERG